ncbi:acyl-CoA synthetase [Marinovum sp.]|uniref:acyl-CoA synthetase n=1 Tax=Marinovum sp. TaxID=2024839 RepID=UPI002B26D253|nr:acyl-CoA synthetase [Marinovum sp.]
MTELLYPIAPEARDPDKIAYEIAETGETVTYAALEHHSRQAAQLFRACGLKPGDHIALLSENNRQFLEICFAADRAGLYYTPISTHATPAEAEYIVANCDARLWIVTARKPEIARHLAAALPQVQHRYTIGGAVPPCADWDEARSAQPTTRIADEAQGLDMLYSSGTTGRPKGIKWPRPDSAPGGRTRMVDTLSGIFGYGPDTRYLSPAPLYHAAPLRHSMTNIKMGGTVTITQRFDAETALKLIESRRITHSQWVPTMFQRLLKLPDEVRQGYDCSSLKVAVHAAAPCPVHVKEAMIDWWGPILHEYYSGTEGNGFCALNSKEWLAHPGSVGRALDGVLHICDEDGRELPPGEVGTVWFSDGRQFAYHNDPDATAKAYDARGWSTIGDIGRLDADGYLYLSDRKSFVIISGGVNIYPQETENLLLSHPEVEDAAVIGVPNEDFGEEVKAVVQLVTGCAPSPAKAEELIAFCREKLSPIKCPRSVDFRDRLPREATGKLYKRKLRDAYWNNDKVKVQA